MPELLKYTTIPDLEFLEDDEYDHVWKLTDQCPSEQVASRILGLLRRRKGSRREDDFRKFVACIVRASEHRGHQDILKGIQSKLPRKEWSLIQNIVDESETPEPSPYTTPQHSPTPSHHKILQSPEKPVTLISLQGQLVEEKFLEVERKLWLSFSKGSYDNLECLITGVHKECGQFDADCRVVALWFESLVMMHRHVKYEDAIQKLDTALDLIPSCVNETILEGRILQRKAQINLMRGLKNVGSKDFEMAKQRLQFVGRGYDKTNMYCREAKILSATEPHKRTDIEKVYQDALGTLEKDDPYFLASYPSVTLSKAAFHLHFAFGSKLTSKDQIPTVSVDDIQKAKETLAGFNEEEYILIDMRRFEYDLIQAELCRLEGSKGEARKRFTKLQYAGGKTGNIASIATHRLKWMSPKQH